MSQNNELVGARGRLGVLLAFSLLVISTQVLWLSFAAITPESAKVMDVSEGAIGDLAVINAAVFVLLSIPAGRWLDRNYGRTMAIGALCTAVGAVVRTIDPTAFVVVAIGQTIMSVGQPLTLNAITKVALRYFPTRQHTAAISVATAAQFVGILIAVLTSGPTFRSGGLDLVLAVHAGIAVVAAVAVLATLRVRPLPGSDDVTIGADTRSWLRQDPLIWKMAGLLFVGFGAYNGIATWLDSIMTGFGHEGVGGYLIAGVTIAGVLGAAVLPGLVVAKDARRLHAVVTTVALAGSMVLVAFTQSVAVAAVGLVIFGFVGLGLLPVLLDWSAAYVGPEHAGLTAGFLLLAGNLGGVFVVLTVQIADGHPATELAIMAAWALPALLIARLLPRSTMPAEVAA